MNRKRFQIKKLDIELHNAVFSKWNNLSKTDKNHLDYARNHLKKLSNMQPLLCVLLLVMNSMYDFKYSEYIFLIVGIVVIIVTAYIVISTIVTKRRLKSLIFPNLSAEEKANGVKIKIYSYKMFDVMDNLTKYLFFFWECLNLIGILIRIL